MYVRYAQRGKKALSRWA